METLRLLKELENLIMSQKTVLGMTYSFRQENFLDLTNKIRASLLAASFSERTMEKTERILARHLRSQEDIAAVINELRLEANL